MRGQQGGGRIRDKSKVNLQVRAHVFAACTRTPLSCTFACASDHTISTHHSTPPLLQGLEDVYTGGSSEDRVVRSVEMALTRKDEFGRVMTPKERFRQICYQFHGKVCAWLCVWVAIHVLNLCKRGREGGRVMTPNECFRQLCYQLHGNVRGGVENTCFVESPRN